MSTPDAEKLISVHRLLQCLLGERKVNVGYDTEEFRIIKEHWTESFEALDALDTKTGIVHKTVLRAKTKVMMSHFEKSFVENFNAELSLSDPDKLQAELTSIIGEPNVNETNNRLREKFNGMSRRLENSEKFKAYVTRLENVASKLTSDATTKTFIIRQHFLQTISPTEQDFILIHGNPESEVSVQAELLDSKRQHLVSKVNLVERQKVDELEQVQVEMLNEMSRMRETISNLRSETPKEDASSTVAEQLRSLQATVNQIGKGEQKRPSYGRPKPGYSKGGYNKNAPRCPKCGLIGHEKETCYPKTRIECYICHQMGHTQHATDFHPKVSSAKNE